MRKVSNWMFITVQGLLTKKRKGKKNRKVSNCYTFSLTFFASSVHTRHPYVVWVFVNLLPTWNDTLIVTCNIIPRVNLSRPINLIQTSIYTHYKTPTHQHLVFLPSDNPFCDQFKNILLLFYLDQSLISNYLPSKITKTH